MMIVHGRIRKITLNDEKLSTCACFFIYIQNWFSCVSLYLNMQYVLGFLLYMLLV